MFHFLELNSYIWFIVKRRLLDFEVDRLTNSIVNTISGDSFQTEIALATYKDLESVKEENGWAFNWNEELDQNDRDVYKLTIMHNSEILQGLVSLTIETDHVHMNLLESAPFNKGKDKLYEGVPGNLVAYACKLSFQRGNDGHVAFRAKTKLIEHYIKNFDAVLIGRNLMIINPIAANKLVEKYFKT